MQAEKIEISKNKAAFCHLQPKLPGYCMSYNFHDVSSCSFVTPLFMILFIMLLSIMFCHLFQIIHIIQIYYSWYLKKNLRYLSHLASKVSDKSQGRQNFTEVSFPYFYYTHTQTHIVFYFSVFISFSLAKRSHMISTNPYFSNPVTFILLNLLENSGCGLLLRHS